tara:strand:- start:729 stop:1019 length:291 start_codon:yes stop_codon:yes gene_type:complete
MKKIPEDMTEEECHATEWPVWVVSGDGAKRSFVHESTARSYAHQLSLRMASHSIECHAKLGATFEKPDPDADGEGIMRTWEKDDFVMAFAFGWVVE